MERDQARSLVILKHLKTKKLRMKKILKMKNLRTMTILTRKRLRRLKKRSMRKMKMDMNMKKRNGIVKYFSAWGTVNHCVRC